MRTHGWPFVVRTVRRCRWAVFLLVFPSLCQAGIDWDAAWKVRMNGQTLSVEMFTSRLSPDAVLRELVRRNPAYARYQIAAGRILVSGIAEGTHWLAQIQGHPDGAQGYVSALYFRHESGALAPGAVNAGQASVARLFEFDGSVNVRFTDRPSAAAGAGAPDTRLSMGVDVLLPEQ